ncbi:unnamed protein product [Soboliphyme baturini]|uniref:Ig-like domain-containing protein n=1 Tax=Soboliphyme baturini TaxID=241478 RepID=A0A183IKD5_9BILA|nr:unnamed protein product [Soboliphyme baturini]
MTLLFCLFLLLYTCATECQEMPKKDEWVTIPPGRLAKLLKTSPEKKVDKKKLVAMTAELRYKKYAKVFRKQQQRKLSIVMKNFGNEVVQMEGGTIILTCPAEDTDDTSNLADLEWQRNAHILENGTYDERRITMNKEGRLLISPTLSVDSGRYSCYRNEVYVAESTLRILATSDAVGEGMRFMFALWCSCFLPYVGFFLAKYSLLPPAKEEEEKLFSEEEDVSPTNRARKMKQIVDQTIRVLRPPEEEDLQEEDD